MSDLDASRRDADRLHMDRCSTLAAEARRSGNTAVGSVVAIGGKVISEASEAVPAGPDPFAHAELIAVRDAMARFGRSFPNDATLYTTHEPCLLCSYAIREAGIARVVMAVPTPDIGGVTSNHPILVATDVERWMPPPTVEWWDEQSEPTES